MGEGLEGGIPPPSEIKQAISPQEQVVPKGQEARQTTAPVPEQPEQASRELAEVRQEIAAATNTEGGEAQSPAPRGRQRPHLAGDFTETALDNIGRIVLPEQTMQEVTGKVTAHKRQYHLSLPSIASGAHTATEYSGQAANFSTRTGIMTLADGRKVFIIYDYPLSGIHRALDGLATHGAGDRMAKASKQEWKKRVEEKSNIPIIACDLPHVVLLPYIENVNAHDAFALNRKISNVPTEFEWVKDLSLEDKIQLGESVIRELAEVHTEGKTWGETILPNMIITKDKQVIIVDPETAYDADVEPTEQRARDLRDAVFSIAGALHKSEGLDDYGSLVKQLLDQYPDKKVIQNLKQIVSQQPSPIQKFFTLIHETVRLGVSMGEMKKLTQEIAAY